MYQHAKLLPSLNTIPVDKSPAADKPVKDVLHLKQGTGDSGLCAGLQKAFGKLSELID